MINNRRIIYKNNTEKETIDKSYNITFYCAKTMVLSWFSFFNRFIPIASKYMPSISSI